MVIFKQKEVLSMTKVKEKKEDDKLIINNEDDKKSNKKIIILMIIVLVIIILSIGGYFIYQEIKFREPIKEEWGQKYYVYLKEQDDILPKDSENAKVNFIEADKEKDPVMIVKYEVKKKFTRMFILFMMKKLMPLYIIILLTSSFYII